MRNVMGKRHRRAAFVPAARTASVLMMTGSLVAAGTLGANAAPATATAPAVTDLSGSLPNGATWKAEVPANWNGTLLLFSHGYVPSFAGVPNTAQDAPNPDTAAVLLAKGYALTGSSYATAGWALNTAAKDQMDTLAATVQAIGRRPQQVLAYGASMGGLVTAKLAETAGDDIQGALAICGIVGGGSAMTNYHLDGQLAISRLLAPGKQIKLTRYAGLDEAAATTSALTAAVQQAQNTPAGRARVALAAALYQAPAWAQGQEPPVRNDPAAVERGQYQNLLQNLPGITLSRVDLETAIGGNAAWNTGVDYRRLMSRSSDRDTVRALYRKAGLSLDADLRTLTAAAATSAEPHAVRRMFDTSVPYGRLQMPVLTLHNTDDPVVPVQHETAYRNTVTKAGKAALLRQAYVNRPGHCNVTPAELVAALNALEHRVDTGHWDGGTTPEALQREARRLALGEAAYVRFSPGKLQRETFGPNNGIPFAVPTRPAA